MLSRVATSRFRMRLLHCGAFLKYLRTFVSQNKLKNIKFQPNVKNSWVNGMCNRDFT